MNKCLEERDLPRIPIERNCQHPRPLGECVQDVDASLATLREMQKEPEHEVPCLVLEGQLLLNQERFEEALATFSRAAAKSSDLPEDVNMILQLEGLLPESGLSDERQPVSPDVAANAFSKWPCAWCDCNGMKKRLPRLLLSCTTLPKT